MTCVWLVAAQVAGAADTRGSDWLFWARAFYADSNSDIRVDSQTVGVAGTLIDFEDDLGIDRRKALPMFGAQWRFAERHQVGLAYFALRRSGELIIDEEIRWGDALYPIGADISSFFDTEVTRLAYRYDLVPGRQADLWIGGGIHITDMSAGLTETTLGGVAIGSSAPLPMLTGALNYRVAPNWTLAVMGEWFGIELGDIEGALWHGDLALHWQAWERFGLAIGFNYFELDFGLGDADFRGLFDYRYMGPFLGVDISF